MQATKNMQPEKTAHPIVNQQGLFQAIAHAKLKQKI